MGLYKLLFSRQVSVLFFYLIPPASSVQIASMPTGQFLFFLFDTAHPPKEVDGRIFIAYHNHKFCIYEFNWAVQPLQSKGGICMGLYNTLLPTGQLFVFLFDTAHSPNEVDGRHKSHIARHGIQLWRAHIFIRWADNSWYHKGLNVTAKRLRWQQPIFINNDNKARGPGSNKSTH